MYSFIYYYTYKLIEKRNYQARMYAGLMVFIAQLGHVLVLYAVAKKLFGLKIPVLNNDPTINRIMLLPLFLIWIVAVIRFFYRSFFKIKGQYEIVKIITAKNSLLYVLVVLIPFIIGIIISNSR